MKEANLNDLNQLGAILRIEGKFQSKKDLRIAFESESTNIRVLLNSDANPVERLFKSIVDTKSFKNVPNSIIAEMSMNDFKNYQYTGALVDNALLGSLDRTREGYMEVIEMGVVIDPVMTGFIKHSAAGVPANCAALDAYDALSTAAAPVAMPQSGPGAMRFCC